jgi:hypothetical protein
MTALIVVTIVSLAAAIAMSVFAWRLASEERARSEARVAALAAEIHRGRPTDDRTDPERSAVAINNLFAGKTAGREHGGALGTLAIGVVVVGTLLAIILTFTSGSPERPTAPVVAETAALVGEPADFPPLELVALGHDRQGDRLTVRGIVRGAKLADTAGPLTAVVYVFDRKGTFVASGRAPLVRATSDDASDVESTFSVTISGIQDVHRYRVSFRNEDRTLAHVDRRDTRLSTQLP